MKLDQRRRVREIREKARVEVQGLKNQLEGNEGAMDLLSLKEARD